MAELKDDKVAEYTITPEQFDMARAGLEGLKVASVEDSLKLVNAVLDNQPGPAHDIVSLNAGAAIYAAGVADTLAAGVSRAQAVISSGAARQKFDAFIDYTRQSMTA